MPEGVFKPILELSSAVIHAGSLLALVSDLILLLLLLFGSWLLRLR